MKRVLLAVFVMAAAAAISALVVLLSPDETPPAPPPLPPVPPSDRPLAGGPPVSVSLSLAAEPAVVQPGDRVILKLRLINQHRIDDLRAPALTYTWPEGWEFVSSIPDAPFDPRARTVRFETTHVAGGGEGEMRREVTVRAGDAGWAVHHLSAEIGGRPDVLEAEAATNVGPGPALAFDLTDEKDPVKIGVEARATLTVRNPGSAPLRGVALFIEPPFGGAPAIATFDTIAPGEVKTLSAAAAATAAGLYRFRGTVTVGGLVLRDEESVNVID